MSLLANYEYPKSSDYHDELAKWPKFLTDNLDQVFAATMLLIPMMGKQLNQFVKELGVLKNAFDEINKSKEEEELDELNEYLTKFHQAEGGIYESNVVTLIIQEWLKDIKVGGKRNILIIDDLDRIDPNHIFRLLNIFSAHFDSRDSGDAHNKFGFDQVVMVCDVSNVENIFRAQYGIRSDFNGYIDKFYSKEVYRFDNDQNIIRIIQSILDRLQLLWAPEGEILEHSSGEHLKGYVLPILQEMVLSRLLNLRSLFKFYDQSLLLPDKSYRIKGDYVLIYESYALSVLHLLALFLGDLNSLKSKVDSMTHLYLNSEDKPDRFVAELIMLHNRKLVDRDRLLHVFRHENIRFEMNLRSVVYKGYFSVHRPHSHTWTSPFTVLNELIINDEPVDVKLESYDAIDLFRETLDLI